MPLGEYRIINGECLETMASMDENSVDAIVCDPPYNLGFMGKGWDSFGFDASSDFDSERRKAMDYVGNKGQVPRFGNSHGHAPKRDENLAFQEAMTPIFEEALRVAKPGAYLLAFGSPRTFHRLACAIEDAGWVLKDTVMWTYGSGMPKGQRAERLLEQAGYDEIADEWQGFNTQLKPAWEPVVMAQKPLDGTVANNIAKWGVGVLNIDGCRVPYKSDDDMSAARPQGRATSKVGAFAGHTQNDRERTEFEASQSRKGRFPANFIHDGSDEVLALFPDNAGQMAYRAKGGKKTKNCYGNYADGAQEAIPHDTLGSAARFFYCAKASKQDRNLGGVDNVHVSVKPNTLMRWLVRLVCPKGGTVLDPFMGSGSTGVACMDEGMSFVGIDMDEHYCEISEVRIRAAVARNAQMSLF